MATEELFRFVHVRAPRPVSNSTKARAYVQVIPDIETNDFAKTIRDATKVQRIPLSLNFIDSKAFVDSDHDLTSELQSFKSELLSQEELPFGDDLEKSIKGFFGTSSGELVGSNAFKDLETPLSNSVLAAKLAGAKTDKELGHLLPAFQAYHLILDVSKKAAATESSAQTEALLNRSLVIPDGFPVEDEDTTKELARIKKKQEKARQKYQDTKDKAAAQAREAQQRMLELMEAIEDIKKFLPTHWREEATQPTESDSLVVIPDPKALKKSAKNKDKEKASLLDLGEELSFTQAFPPISRLNYFSKGIVDKLNISTMNLLKDLHFSRDEINYRDAIMSMEAEIDRIAKNNLRNDSSLVIKLGTDLWDIDGLGDPGNNLADQWAWPNPNFSMARVKPVGIADLLKVRQEIIAYEAGEVAHIENILEGEAKERSHRRRREKEETFSLTEENEEESERDLQSTSRFELQRESQKTIDKQTATEAGVKVTAAYGVIKEATAQVGRTSQETRKQSQSDATGFSQEVVEKSAYRVKETVKEQRTNRILEEVEEINMHKFDNTSSDGNISGVYRWVDKIYKAQVVNYGRRMMFEFILPEPAAFYRWSLIQNKVQISDTIRKPMPPVDHHGDPLQASALDQSNYRALAAAYQADNVEPPPPFYKIISTSLEQTYDQGVANAGRIFSVSKPDGLTIPDGYFANRAYVESNKSFLNNTFATMYYLIGLAERPLVTTERENGRLTHRVFRDTRPIPLNQETGNLPISMWTRNITVGVVHIEVECELSSRAFDEWQIDTFSKIMTGYRAMLSKYEEAVAAARARNEGFVTGNNPGRNREIERVELKRQAIAFMTNQHFDTFDAMRHGVAPWDYPEMNVSEATNEGKFVQFFEQAFEWSNMTYLFYPYFWSSKQSWPQRNNLSDNDPLFGNFLRAGSSRVQVPVRPGFEASVLHYLEHEDDGAIWSGGAPPLIGNPLHLAMIDEVKETLGEVFQDGQGKIQVTINSKTVNGLGTDFDDSLVDHELRIAGKRYRISEVESRTELTLYEAYQGPTSDGLLYAIGPKLVGEAWEVRLPTTLVQLQGDSTLPTFDR